MDSKKQNRLPLWAIIAISVLVVAVLVVGVLFAVDYINKNKNTLKSYTASAEELVQHKDRVVAKVGEYELTNAELQIYYWVCAYSFIEENSYYISLMGLDYTKDFGTQECYLEKGISWQEYFIDQALAAWYQYTVLNVAATEENFQLSEEEQTYLNELKDTMDAQAVKYGYKDAEEMIQKEMGAGATFDAYMTYTNETFKGMGFYSQFAGNLGITEEDLEQHYANNLEKYTQNKVAKKGEAYCVSVRHILICPVTKDADGNEIDTDTAWETCRQTAQSILDGYLAAGKIDEEAFAALAKEKTEDTGSKTNGGLYEDFYRGKMVEEFEAWSFDVARQYGDTGLVKTSYGYHIMFFVDKNETYRVSVRHILMKPVTKDADGNTIATDVAWETCRQKAQSVLDGYVAGGKIDEDAFAALAKTYTDDTGTKDTGGLCAQFIRGQMVEEFEAWSFDAARQYGDVGLVKSEYGYHVMFFVEGEVEWRCFADYDLRNEACNELLNDLKNRYPFEADYNKILIGHVDLGK